MITEGHAFMRGGFKRQSKVRLGQEVGTTKLGEKQRHKEGVRKATRGVALI
jgi:hypothetical protein